MSWTSALRLVSPIVAEAATPEPVRLVLEPTQVQGDGVVDPPQAPATACPRSPMARTVLDFK
jgi:hypothetical protein